MTGLATKLYGGEKELLGIKGEEKNHTDPITNNIRISVSFSHFPLNLNKLESTI